MKVDDTFDNDFSRNECEVAKIIRDRWIIIDQWTVNSDGFIDVNGNVAFSTHFKCLTDIPLRFNVVTGDFDCSGLGLKTLEGCPNEVGGTFDCTYNQLLSLEHAPKKVGGAFMFDDTVRSIYTGTSCDYNEVIMFYRTKNIEMIGLPKIIIENAVHLPIIFKYLDYYCNDDKSFNEENMIDLIEDIMDGLT